MPLNLLKHYPELLEIDHMSYFVRTKSLRGVYQRDIEDNDNFCFLRKRIYPIKSEGQVDMDRQFTHLTCEEIKEEDENGHIVRRRVFDKYRSERLHWIKTHTDEATNEKGIVIFSLRERNQRKRMDVVRTYIYNKKRKYVIVFEPQKRNGSSYYLLTAYYLNKDYGLKQIENKLKKRLENVL